MHGDGVPSDARSAKHAVGSGVLERRGRDYLSRGHGGESGHGLLLGSLVLGGRERGEEGERGERERRVMSQLVISNKYICSWCCLFSVCWCVCVWGVLVAMVIGGPVKTYM